MPEDRKYRKPRPCKRDGRTYNREMVGILMDFAPPIIPCADCTHPVAQGYCCRWCGSDDPDREAD